MTRDHDIRAAEQLSREAEELLEEYFRIRREYNALDRTNADHADRRSTLRSRYHELDRRYSSLVKTQEGIVEGVQGPVRSRADVLWQGALDLDAPEDEPAAADRGWIEMNTPGEGAATDAIFEQALREIQREPSPEPVVKASEQALSENGAAAGVPEQPNADDQQLAGLASAPPPAADALRELNERLRSGELADISAEPGDESAENGDLRRVSSETISKALLTPAVSSGLPKTKPSERPAIDRPGRQRPAQANSADSLQHAEPASPATGVRPMPCPSCGEILPAGTEACLYCGARLIAGDTAEGVADRVPPHLQLKPPKQKEKPNVGPKLLITFGWLLVLVAATWLIVQGWGLWTNEINAWLDARDLGFVREEEAGGILGVAIVLLGGTVVGVGVFAGHFIRVVVPLHELARSGRVETIEKLILRGDEIDVRDERGCTPLHFAVVAGQREAVAVLAGNGADLNSHNDRGDTPLHMAVANRDRALVHYLLNKGADAEAVNESGSTLMHVAAWVGDVGLLKLLLERGLAMDAKTKVGFTPLHFAAQSGHDDAISFLLERGVAPNASSEHGTTPIFPAARNGHLNAIRLLIGGGADYNVRRGHDFESPLGVARIHKRREIYDYLESLGAED